MPLSGIGLELTRQLVARGDHVVACCRKPAEASKLQELQKANKEALNIVEMDVRDAASIKVSLIWMFPSSGGPPFSKGPVI